MSYDSDMRLVMSALSTIAAQGKPVEIDQELADHMGLVPDPAVSETEPDLFALAA